MRKSHVQSELTFPLIWYLDIKRWCQHFYDEVCLLTVWDQCVEIALPIFFWEIKMDTAVGGNCSPPHFKSHKPGLPTGIQCRVYFCPCTDEPVVRRSSREAVASGICQLSPSQCLQWLRGTWGAALLWNAKRRVTSLVAAVFGNIFGWTSEYQWQK